MFPARATEMVFKEKKTKNQENFYNFYLALFLCQKNTWFCQKRFDIVKEICNMGSSLFFEVKNASFSFMQTTKYLTKDCR